MASGYYSSSSSSQSQQPALPLHLCFFLFVLLIFIGISWYSNYESMLEDFFDQVKLILMISPLVLLLVLHLLSNFESSYRKFPSIIPLPEKESLHRAGGTPWGVGFLLVFLLFMISYQSSLQERWFPILSR